MKWWRLFKKDPGSEGQSHPTALAIKTAVQHHTAGRFAEAEAIYLQVLAVDANNFDALHLLGVLMNQTGDRARAIELISLAIAVDPADPTAHYNLGTVYGAANRSEEAIGQYQKALAIQPDYLGARFNLGNVFEGLGRFDEALASYSIVMSLHPAFADAHNSAGTVHGARSQWNEAVLSFQRALSIKPDFAQAHSNLGRALKAQGKFDEALASYLKALSLNPDLMEANASVGILHSERGRLDQAIPFFQRALAIDPDSAGTHYNLGHALAMQGNRAEALLSYRKALTLSPEYAEARWAHTMAQIPLVYDLDADPQNFRNAFSRELAELAAWFAADPERMASGFKAVGTHQPFYLAYQEEDNRHLLARYGELCARLMGAWREGPRVAAPVALARPKIALGIVSANFCTHSVWNAIIKGLLLQLDRARFELHLFSVSGVPDEETAFAKAQASHFEQGRKDLPEWVQVVRNSRLDVLIYPEIGMDGMTAKLAGLRLAPVQVMTWGHPQTSGLPTIDYFLSAEDFEPADAHGGQSAQEHYSEQLITLPHLGCCYPPLPVTAAPPNLAGVDIDSASPLLLCPGAPFKYLPQHDRIFVEIARRLGKCRILFVVGARLENLSARLRHRLDQSFTRAGLDFSKYVVFIPWQTLPEFYGLMKRVDVFLDTIGFSGFNTVMQAVECGVPIVTLDGRFMRGRLGSGILKRMGLAELVGQTEQEYIDVAVNLARDAGYRRRIRERIQADRHVLFNDTAPVRGLEDFLVNVTTRKH